MKKPTRRGVAVLAALALTLAGLTACGTHPSPDEVYLFYMAGSMDKKEFKECIDPGSNGPEQMNNNVYALPTSLRSWNILPQGGDDNKWISSSSKPGPKGEPGPEVGVYASTDFFLNTNCDGGKDSPVVKFWEQTGRRYGVSDGNAKFSEKGWRDVLINTLVTAEGKALREATKNYTADELDSNANGVWKKIEDELARTFPIELKAKTGGDYFCGPTFDRSKSECPPIRISITEINFADPAIAAARAAVYAAEQKAKADLIAAQAKVTEANLLAQANRTPGYLDLERAKLQLQAAQACASNPNCTLVVGANGVNVGTK